MISGLKTAELRRRVLPLLALLCAAPAAWAFDLPELMGLLGRQPHGQATFVEQRFVHGLEGPLDASGTLSFQAPDKLVRQTLTPRQETMRVDGNVLMLSRGGRTRTLTLDSMPELLGMVDALRGTLAGNSLLLEKSFRTQLEGSSAQWRLQLQPTDQRLAAQVRELVIAGRAGEVLRVEMSFVGGDRSAMDITPVAAVPAAPAGQGSAAPAR